MNIRGDAPYRRPLLAQRCNHLAAVRWRVEIFLLQALVSPKPASSPGIVPQTTIVRCLHHLRPHHCGHSASRIVNLFRSSHSLFTDLCNHRIVFVDRRGEATHSDAINFIRRAIPSLKLRRRSTHECSRNCCAFTKNRSQVQEEHIEELSRVLLLGAKLQVGQACKCLMKECGLARAYADNLALQARWLIHEDRVQPLRPFAKKAKPQGETATSKLVVIQEAETPHTRPSDEKIEILTRRCQLHRARERAT